MVVRWFASSNDLRMFDITIIGYHEILGDFEIVCEWCYGFDAIRFRPAQ